MKAQAGTQENFPTFWASFLAWHKPDKKAPGRPKKEPPPESAPQTQDSKEVSTGETGEGQGPSVDELLAKIADKWPLQKLQAQFGKKREDWGPEEVSKLTDLAQE